MQGKLYVVGTPIGNLDDMVPRATQVLQFVDLVLAEDTRHSGQLLAQLGLSKPLKSCHDHNEKELAGQVVDWLRQGKNIALVSDAGTPLISDPGFNLVRLAREQGVEVVPVPGACAAILALSAAGLPADRFSFVGFPPAKSGPRKTWLQEIGHLQHTLVAYEAPHRILDLLDDLIAVLGSARFLVVGRELTKRYESWYRGTAQEVRDQLAADPQHLRGEFVVLLQGEPSQGELDAAELHRYLKVLLEELPPSRAAAIAAKLLGAPKQTCYQVALAIQQASSEVP